MNRTAMTCLVGVGLILAGALKTALQEHIPGKQPTVGQSLKSRGTGPRYRTLLSTSIRPSAR
jgi:hypothetical protein